MTITDRLLADHKAFRKILDDLESVARRPVAERNPVQLRKEVSLLKRMILFHARVEDEVYFPAAAKAGTPVAAEFIPHLMQEHKTIEGYLLRLEAQVSTRPVSASWPQTFSLLATGLRGHFKREEEELFPQADAALGADGLAALAQEADRRKSEQ